MLANGSHWNTLARFHGSAASGISAPESSTVTASRNCETTHGPEFSTIPTLTNRKSIAHPTAIASNSEGMNSRAADRLAGVGFTPSNGDNNSKGIEQKIQPAVHHPSEIEKNEASIPIGRSSTVTS